MWPIQQTHGRPLAPSLILGHFFPLPCLLHSYHEVHPHADLSTQCGKPSPSDLSSSAPFQGSLPCPLE